MARINIEECWWTDPRRSALIRILGKQELADGIALQAWRLAQEFWKKDRQLVPKALFEMLEGASALLGACLAEVRGDMVYIRGSSAYLDWINEKKEAGRAGGKISALRARDEKGRLLPKNIQAESKQNPSKPKCVQPSSSSSSSSSKEEYIGLDFEKIYQEYPQRKGSQRKAVGLKICEKKFDQPQLYDSLLVATRNYAAHCKREKKTGTEFVSQFATFVGGIWEEWVAGPNSVALQPKQPEEYFS